MGRRRPNNRVFIIEFIVIIVRAVALYGPYWSHCSRGP